MLNANAQRKLVSNAPSQCRTLLELIESVAYLPLGHLGICQPSILKIYGPLRPWPPLWFLAIVVLNLNYLLHVEHLMYRLKYPVGLAIYYYYLLLFIVTVG